MVLSSAVTSYRDLLVWQGAMDLAIIAYRLSGQLPRTQTYGLAAQLQRAAVSIAANIAEGHGRESTGDYLRFLAIAAGSLSEFETHVLLCERLDLVTGPDVAPALKTADELGKMLRALRRALAARLETGAREPDSAPYSPTLDPSS